MKLCFVYVAQRPAEAAVAREKHDGHFYREMEFAPEHHGILH